MIDIERVRKRLEALGLNPNSASQKAGLNRDYVRDILRGRIREPSALRLSKLANALECEPQDLLGDEIAPTDHNLTPENDPFGVGRWAAEATFRNDRSFLSSILLDIHDGLLSAISNRLPNETSSWASPDITLPQLLAIGHALGVIGLSQVKEALLVLGWLHQAKSDPNFHLDELPADEIAPFVPKAMPHLIKPGLQMWQSIMRTVLSANDLSEGLKAAEEMLGAQRRTTAREAG
jgi:transcriptional regulator with XRE-family HTH domain